MTTRIPSRRPSDETLMAFADNMLDAEEARAVESYLDSDQEARELVEQFRQAGAIASRAYDDVLLAPVPDRLVKAVLGAGIEQSAQTAADNVVQLPQRGPRRSISLIYLAPLAASVLLAVGVIAGYRLANAPEHGEQAVQLAIGPVAPASSLAGVLEKRPSNDPIDVGASGKGESTELMVVASFIDRNGRFCREFEATSTSVAGAKSGATAPITAAIACRDNNGKWSIEGAVHLAGGTSPSLGAFNPASGKSYSAVEGLLSALGAKPAMTADDELHLLASGWRRKN